jgi:hypothetical protein
MMEMFEAMADQFPHLVGMLAEISHDDPDSRSSRATIRPNSSSVSTCFSTVSTALWRPQQIRRFLDVAYARTITLRRTLEGELRQNGYPVRLEAELDARL